MIDGERFEGGKGEGLSLVLGSANFIPGFEKGLEGVKAGESRKVHGTFPEAYPVKELAGKAAVFDCNVSLVEKPAKPAIDEEFAKGLGVENLDKLKELVSTQIKGEYDMAARAKLKRELLDVLETKHDFELPPSLVEREFQGVWAQLERSLKARRQEPCRRGQERGRGQGRVPKNCRAARPPRSGRRRDRRQGQDRGDAGRAAPGADGAGAPLPGSGEGGLRVLREDAGRAAGTPRADFRG